MSIHTFLPPKVGNVAYMAGTLEERSRARQSELASVAWWYRRIGEPQNQFKVAQRLGMIARCFEFEDRSWGQEVLCAFLCDCSTLDLERFCHGYSEYALLVPACHSINDWTSKRYRMVLKSYDMTLIHYIQSISIFVLHLSVEPCKEHLTLQTNRCCTVEMKCNVCQIQSWYFLYFYAAFSITCSQMFEPRDYLTWLTWQRTGPITIDTAGRNDIREMEVPQKRAMFILQLLSAVSGAYSYGLWKQLLLSLGIM